MVHIIIIIVMWTLRCMRKVRRDTSPWRFNRIQFPITRTGGAHTTPMSHGRKPTVDCCIGTHNPRVELPSVRKEAAIRNAQGLLKCTRTYINAQHRSRNPNAPDNDERGPFVPHETKIKLRFGNQTISGIPWACRSP
jgi:hypothetical protein